MSSNKEKRNKFWDFVTGFDRSPRTSDIIRCLSEGYSARAEVLRLYKSQKEIENNRKKIEHLKKKLDNSVYDSLEYHKTLRKLKNLLSI